MGVHWGGTSLPTCSLEPDVFVSDVGVITRGVLPARELQRERERGRGEGGGMVIKLKRQRRETSTGTSLLQAAKSSGEELQVSVQMSRFFSSPFLN